MNRPESPSRKDSPAYRAGSPRAAVVVAAAGRGLRFGGSIPKQFAILAGRPILENTLARLAAAESTRIIIAVYAPAELSRMESCCRNAVPENIPRLLENGGETRFESVLKGLRRLAEWVKSGKTEFIPEVVVIHDGARPYVEPALVDEVAAAALVHGAALAALPVSDTLKRSRRGESGGLFVDETLPREGLYRAQTPQALKWPEALEWYENAAASADEPTDDVSVAELAGIDVKIVTGSPANIKVTWPEDLAHQGYSP